jgi:hypothetical protein
MVDLSNIFAVKPDKFAAIAEQPEIRVHSKSRMPINPDHRVRALRARERTAAHD